MGSRSRSGTTAPGSIQTPPGTRRPTTWGSAPCASARPWRAAPSAWPRPWARARRSRCGSRSRASRRLPENRAAGAPDRRTGQAAGGPDFLSVGQAIVGGMPKLSATDRARLPASAFAYVDSAGRRRLPIHDESHVRNALARFERVKFEDDAARERARRRLLNAAKRYGIVPVGFITGQLRSERALAAADGAAIERERLQGEMRAGSTDAATLPTGLLTFLLTDIEDSTGLLRRMGDTYADLLAGVRGAIRAAVVRGKGREVDARADEFFAVFTEASPALQAAMRIQRALPTRVWGDGHQ